MSDITVAAHTDIMGSVIDRYRQNGQTAVFEQRHAKVVRQGSVDVISDHLGGDTRYGYVPAPHLRTDPLARALRLFDHAHRESEESPSLTLVQSVSDIRLAKNDGKISLVASMEGGSPLCGSLSVLRNFYRLGLRSLGLTHNWRNELGDGCLERTGGGLTHFGKDVVATCNELGIVIDVAHLSAEGVGDVLDLTEQPIIASHTNPSALAPHPHNLDDEYLLRIANGGGVIGVFFLSSYLSPKLEPTLEDVVDVIKYLVSLVGVDHVAVGPDIMENWDQAEFKAVTEGAGTFESVPVRPIDYVYPPGLHSISGLPTVQDALFQSGMDDVAVSKIFGGNCLRLWEDVWGN